MAKNRKQSGFSLTEMLIATGIMAIGLVMVATIFPVGIKLTTLTTERTTGAVVADEAFAKVQLYGLRDFNQWPAFPNVDSSCSDFQYLSDYREYPGVDGVFGTIDDLPLESDWDDFRYPSTVVPVGQNRNYHWSALCRRVQGSTNEVQVTVFVCRKIGAGAQYRSWDFDPSVSEYIVGASPWPKPVPVVVDFTYSDTDPLQNKKLILTDPQPDIFGSTGFDITDCLSFFDDGYTIIDNYSGRIYRVLEVDRETDTLILQQDWVDNALPTNETIWVVPPAAGSDRYPCVGVYQKVIRFDNPEF